MKRKVLKKAQTMCDGNPILASASFLLTKDSNFERIRNGCAAFMDFFVWMGKKKLNSGISFKAHQFVSLFFR